MTTEVLNKLEEVFALGGTDTEACMYADISPRTLYKYQEENPDFVQRKEALKEKPFLKARKTIVESLNDPNHAFKFMERKKKAEFGQNVDVTSDGQALPPVLVKFLNAEDNPDSRGVSAPL